MADPTLALFYEFARNKSLVASKGLGPTFDIVRAGGAATRVNELGLIETVVANTPRFDFDPVTLKSLGLLIEEDRTNLALQSSSFSSAPWTNIGTPVINPTSVIAPDGTLTAHSINDNNGASFEGVEQQFTVLNDSATYAFSLYIQKTAPGAAPTMGVNLFFLGGIQPGDKPIPRIATDTGEVQDPTGGTRSRIVDAGDYWRIETTITNNSTGNTTLVADIHAATSANGFFVNVSSAIGINRVWGALMKLGAFSPSYIPTTTATVTQAADVPKTTDISDINTSEGVLYIDFTTGNIDQNTTVLSLDSEMSSNRMALEIINGNIRFRGVAGGDVQWNISTAATADTDYRAAIAYKANDIGFWLNGTQVGVDLLATIPIFTTLHIGCDFNELEQLNEHVREVRHYNIRSKPDQFLEDLTNGLISEDNDLTFARHVARPSVRDLPRTF